MTPIAYDRGQRIQVLALALFDHGTEAHKLPVKAGRLLQFAAAFYVAAAQADTDRADRAARDLVLAGPIADLSPGEQAIVAGVVALQREKVRPRREPAFVCLGGKDRRMTLRLAALLRLARGLEDSAGEPQILAGDGVTTIVVGGEHPDTVAEQAGAYGDLWRDEIGALEVRAGAPDELPIADMAPTNGWEGARALDLIVPFHGALEGLAGGELIAEGGRRVLRRFFDKLLAREEAVRKGEDAEDVHQMRVATRRLRASLQVLEGVYEFDLIRNFRRGLRRIAEPLGVLRDRDVFLAHVLAHRDAQPAEAQAALDPLVAAIEAERAQARERLLRKLDARRYTSFQQRFAAFLTTPGAGVIAPPEHGTAPRVRDYAGSVLWRRYEQWRAYEVALAASTDEVLHQARIAGKRLRYTLELFADALGPNAEQVHAPLVALQENLGLLQDGVVARGHIAALGMQDDHGAQAYLASLEAERAGHLTELPRLWEKVASATYRRRLFELIVKL